MPHDTSPPTRPAPTLFISYASEDREAAKKLRDALSAHDIDVWYDEDELTGGDAWDQKIRRRIRECDYFMPVISHATQARREGYFRREWRQAAERTLDMADDVMFLVPVNISDILEAGSRVPERFQQVHWTRCPNGESNVAFEELCRQVLTGEEAPSVTSQPAVKRRPAPSAKPPPEKNGKGLPPYPPQPHRKTDEPAWLHIFNLLVWVVRCAYRAYRGFPRILRWVVIIWAIFFLLGRCQAPSISLDNQDDEASSPTDAIAELASATSSERGDDLSGFGRFLGAMADVAQAGRTFAIVPITATGQSESTIEFTNAVVQGLIARLDSNFRDSVSFSPVPLGAPPAIEDLIARIGRVEAKFLFTGWVETPDDEDDPELHLVLQPADQSLPAWHESFPIEDNAPDEIAATVRHMIDEMGVFAAEPEESL